MKKFFGIFLVTICSLFIVSCSDDDDAPDTPDSKNKETVIVFFPHTGNLYSALSNNLRDIEQAMLRTENNPEVIVYMNYGNGINNACIYKIKRRGNVCVHDTLRKYTENPYRTPEGMASLFSEIRQLTPNTTDYKMIIGCHGMGWIYSKDQDNIAKKYPSMAYSYNTDEDPVTRWMGSGNVKIDLDMFASALQKASIHPSMMLFDVCYMSNIETLYELRNTADYVVGSAVEIMGRGMPYFDIWSDIIAPVTRQSLDALCSKVYQSYNTSSQPYCTISAVDCSRLDSLASVVRTINQNYELPDSLSSRLQSLDGYVPTLFYDMGRYVELQCTDAGLLELYRNAEADAVFSRYHTSQYYSSLYGEKYGANTITYCSGVTTSASSVNPYAKAGWKHTAWYKATH